MAGRTVVVSAKFTPAVHKALAEADLTELVEVGYGELFARDKASALIADLATFVAWLPRHAAASARRARNVTSGP